MSRHRVEITLLKLILAVLLKIQILLKDERLDDSSGPSDKFFKALDRLEAAPQPQLGLPEDCGDEWRRFAVA